MKKKIIAMAALSLLLGGGAPAAADNAALEKQVQELIKQNRMLTERLRQVEDTLEKQMANQAGGSGPAAAVAEGDGSLLQMINDHVELSGLIEVEASKARDYADEDTSDVTLATVEIGLDARLSEWSSAHLLLLYEEGEENDHLLVDEGTIVLGNTEKFPLYLTAGKMYLPFGFYETYLVSDPLTLELGEINDSALLLGFEASGFYGSLYAFNGHINEVGEEDEIDTWGASLGYGYEGDGFGFDVGMDWISNIGDTDGLGGYLEDDIGIDVVDDYVDGFAAHAFFNVGPFGLIGEYVTALDEFEPAEIAFDNDGAEPEALVFETTYTMELFNRETVFALGYQTTDEAMDLGLPEVRYLGAVSFALFDHTTLAFEYLHDEDYDRDEGGTGEDGNAATMQLAVEF